LENVQPPKACRWNPMLVPEDAQPDFQLSLSHSSITINQGSHRKLGITVTSIGHFNSKVVMNVPQVPSWVVIHFEPSNEVTPPSDRSATIHLVLDVFQNAAPRCLPAWARAPGLSRKNIVCSFNFGLRGIAATKINFCFSWAWR